MSNRNFTAAWLAWLGFVIIGCGFFGVLYNLLLEPDCYLIGAGAFLIVVAILMHKREE